MLEGEAMTGRTVRRARVAAGWRAVDLAAVLGVHVNTVWRWERGEVSIPVPLQRLILVSMPAAVLPILHGAEAGPEPRPVRKSREA